MSALPAVLISAYVAWVAYQQYRTNREKLRLDLYDRRFSVYVAAIDFYHMLLGYDGNNQQHQDAHRAFIKAVRESRFLFGPESAIVSILEEMHVRTARITGFKDLPDGFSKSDPHEYQRLFQAQQDDYLWIGGEQGLLRLEAALMPFLDFRKASSLR
ncbi:hypothetical protein [Burkholderia ubonensis]|uniref:hypothetical protein n=1 Tax=Burkholderia ubonensis TaxID=101571 RepID=UPI0012F8D058|nr:hypothetical protein [Burkholderia ubonensis]